MDKIGIQKLAKSMDVNDFRAKLLFSEGNGIVIYPLHFWITDYENPVMFLRFLTGNVSLMAEDVKISNIFKLEVLAEPFTRVEFEGFDYNSTPQYDNNKEKNLGYFPINPEDVSKYL